MTFDADLTACAALVEKGDPDRFAAAMASPLAARQVLFPLYAFNVEVARAPWVTQEPMIAEMRLQWWRDALDEIAQGRQVRRHEVVTPLAAFLEAEDAGILDRLVAARRWDIYRDSFEDAAHFERYLKETAAGLMWVAARVLARGGEALPGLDRVEETVRGWGHASGLARFLQAVPRLEEQGRIPLVDGRRDAIAELARGALATTGRLRRAKRDLPVAMRPALTEAFLTEAVLTQVVKDPGRVAAGSLCLSSLRRSWLLWRAAYSARP